MQPDNPDEQRARESRRILRDVERDSQLVSGSRMEVILGQARDHFSGADADQDDRIEVIGRRIGRGLSLVFFAGLCIYLFVTYVLR